MTLNHRLWEGYCTQKGGGGNPSGLLYSLERMIEDCSTEGVAACEDIGVSLVVHQLHSVMAYPEYDEMKEMCRKAKGHGFINLQNAQLLLLVRGALARCVHMHRSTRALCEDETIQFGVICLYTATKAESYDTDLSAYGIAYDAAESGYHARQQDVA